MGLQLAHLGGTQPRAQALQQLVQAVARAQVFQQQAGRVSAQFFNLQGAQMKVQHRRGQGETRQMLCQ